MGGALVRPRDRELHDAERAPELLRKFGVRRDHSRGSAFGGDALNDGDLIWCERHGSGHVTDLPADERHLLTSAILDAPPAGQRGGELANPRAMLGAAPELELAEAAGDLATAIVALMLRMGFGDPHGLRISRWERKTRGVWGGVGRSREGLTTSVAARAALPKSLAYVAARPFVPISPQAAPEIRAWRSVRDVHEVRDRPPALRANLKLSRA